MTCLNVARWRLIVLMLESRGDTSEVELYDIITKRLKGAALSTVSMCIALSDAQQARVHQLMELEGAPHP